MKAEQGRCEIVESHDFTALLFCYNKNSVKSEIFPQNSIFFTEKNAIILWVKTEFALQEEIYQMKKKKIRLILIILFIVAAALAVWITVSLWISENYIVIREYTADTGKGGHGFRAVVISDLHDHVFGEDNDKLAEKIRQADPDIILMDGDMLNAESEDASVPLSLIRQVKETAPVYYALGNHEEAYIADGHPELEDELAEAGAVVLDKNYTDIEVNGVQIRLGGMYDYAFGLNGNNDALAAPDDTLNFLREFQDTDRLKIMLAHRPDSFIFGDASQVWDVDLVISGHNHGGQVVLPFLGGLYGGDQGWFPEYVHGMYEKGNFQMFVTSGLGSNRQKLPRFNNPPEVAVLTIG